MSRLSLRQLEQQSSETPLAATIHAQITKRTERSTKSGKPFLEVTFSDATGAVTLKAWENHPQFDTLKAQTLPTPVAIEGKFTKNQWGLDGSPWNYSPLGAEDAAALLAGDPTTAAQQSKDFADINSFISSLKDPRLKSLSEHFLAVFGEKFRRTAAARKNHHARRGGLVEHVAQMMRSADAISTAYPYLNRDLLLTGVLFHDCGKLWENTYPEQGFDQLHNLSGEMLGHIPLGIELVNKLWRDLTESSEPDAWQDAKPASDLVRLHLLHLVASHHGTHEFGSPTLPRTPEAFALHYIDNLDAKLEMMKDGYATANQLTSDIYERQFPLPANLVRPLPQFDSPNAHSSS